MNEFIDRHGIPGEDDDRVRAVGNYPRVLRKDRMVKPWSGGYPVVVESDATIQPDWGPAGRQVFSD